MPAELEALIAIKERLAQQEPPEEGRCPPCLTGEHWRCDGHWCACVNILHVAHG